MPLMRVVLFGIAAILACAGWQKAVAGCYEIVGCTDTDHFTNAHLHRLSCQNLIFLRNSIYAERGYCFRRPETLAAFSNRNCRYADADDAPLTGIERANIRAIVKVERAKDCPD